MTNFKVWSCKIVVPIDAVIPDEFDSTPRLAAISSVEQNGIKVLNCFSGWGGTLTETETEVCEYRKWSQPWKRT